MKVDLNRLSKIQAVSVMKLLGAKTDWERETKATILAMIVGSHDAGMTFYGSVGSAEAVKNAFASLGIETVGLERDWKSPPVPTADETATVEETVQVTAPAVVVHQTPAAEPPPVDIGSLLAKSINDALGNRLGVTPAKVHSMVIEEVGKVSASVSVLMANEVKRVNDTMEQMRVLTESVSSQAATIIQSKIDELERKAARRIEIKDVKSGEIRELGVQHFKFDQLLKMCQARDKDGMRLNIWLTGPAGSGKTTAAINVAKALGLQFMFNGAIDTEYKLLGFVDAQGRVVSRPFRQAYEFGGVYLFDEVDASMPGALLAFNAALANGQCDFPGGMVKRHPDCVVIAGANTSGMGATSAYVGRMKQDRAFLDRFAELKWPVDEAMEMAACPDASWCKYVQRARSKAKDKGLDVTISPRASFIGASLLATGMSKADVIESTVRKGMTDEQWKSLSL